MQGVSGVSGDCVTSQDLYDRVVSRFVCLLVC
jgi:hypothetical protein